MPIQPPIRPSRGRLARPAALSALLATALLLLPSAAAGQRLRGACGADSVLTLVGIDTRQGTALFSLEAGRGDRRFFLELPAGGEAARLTPAPSEALFAGSVGPGPVLAAARCGDACLRVERFGGDGWEPLGEPLTPPPRSNLHLTHDLAGHPWAVFHTPRPDAGDERPGMPLFDAWAYRLEDGEWRPHGRLAVAAVGVPGAVPDPARSDAVLSGSGRFSASTTPVSWVPSLPAVAEGRVVAVGDPLSGARLAVVLLGSNGGADERVYVSPDGGRTWRQAPARPEEVAGLDALSDLPAGDRGGPLVAAFLTRGDDEDPGEIFLAELSPRSGWRLLARLPQALRTDTGDQLLFEHLLVPRPGELLLVAGCSDTPGGSGLLVREIDSAGEDPEIAAPRFVPVVKGWDGS